jgi:hypothetical protein
VLPRATARSLLGVTAAATRAGLPQASGGEAASDDHGIVHPNPRSTPICGHPLASRASFPKCTPSALFAPVRGQRDVTLSLTLVLQASAAWRPWQPPH